MSSSTDSKQPEKASSLEALGFDLGYLIPNIKGL